MANSFDFDSATKTSTYFNASFDVGMPLVHIPTIEVIEAQLIDHKPATSVVVKGEIIDAEIVEDKPLFQREAEIWGDVKDGLWGLHCDPIAKQAEEQVDKFISEVEGLLEVGMTDYFIDVTICRQDHPAVVEIKQKETKKKVRSIRQRAFSWLTVASLTLNLLPIGAALVDAKQNAERANEAHKEQVCSIDQKVTKAKIELYLKIVNEYANAPYDNGKEVIQNSMRVADQLQKVGLGELTTNIPIPTETYDYVGVSKSAVENLLKEYCTNSYLEISDRNYLQDQIWITFWRL